MLGREIPPHFGENKAIGPQKIPAPTWGGAVFAAPLKKICDLKKGRATKNVRKRGPRTLRHYFRLWRFRLLSGPGVYLSGPPEKWKIYKEARTKIAENNPHGMGGIFSAL